MAPESLREVAMAEWMRLLDVPYKWGGEESASWDTADYGIDCSGFVRRGLVPVGILPREPDMSAETIFSDAFKLHPRFTDPTKFRRGMLVFFAHPGKPVHHVEVVLGNWPGPRGWSVLTIGASGGDSTTTSVAAAAARNAKVQIHPLPGGWLAAVDPFQGLA